jgi:proteasome lid subunit RPN8/RPN11
MSLAIIYHECKALMLRISEKQVDAIREHGARDYPNECCGIMLGSEVDGAKVVRDLAPIRNLRHDQALAQALLPLAEPGEESERNRFLIDRDEVRRVEAAARARGLDIIGYYHSHPDHPDRPSEYDREHAWPWLSYVIIRVEEGNPRDYASWVLADDRSRFENEPIVLASADFSGPDSVGAGK